MHYRTLCDKYFLSYDGLSELSMTKKWKKNINLYRDKVLKGLNISTYRFLGVLIAMKYVRTLCDKYFLSYDGFSLDFWQEGLGIGVWNQE